MDFSLTQDEELLRDSARTLLRKECPAALLREHIDDPEVAGRLWANLSGWTELGTGQSVDLCLFMEEAGYVALPGPFFPTVALYAPLLEAAGRPYGGESGTVAMAGRSGEWVLNGDDVRRFVLEADGVERIAVVLPGPELMVCAASSVTTRQMATQDFSRRVFEIDVPAGGSQDRIPIDHVAVDSVLERAAVALAAEMVGTSRRLFEMALDYAKQRVQFGRPIGSFQAIQHKLANMALALERTTSAVYYAAMTIDSDDPDRHRAASVAKAAAGEAAILCAKESIQIHGGIGFTWEHDLHMFMRRAYGSEALLGTTGWHHDRLADLILA